MARYTLIDGYLDMMRSEIRWRRDLDDLVSEMEDHLYSTVEHLLATGLEPSAAQQATLDRFGEPEVLAAVYASSNSGGIAVPTQSTVPRRDACAHIRRPVACSRSRLLHDGVL